MGQSDQCYPLRSQETATDIWDSLCKYTHTHTLIIYKMYTCKIIHHMQYEYIIYPRYKYIYKYIESHKRDKI